MTTEKPEDCVLPDGYIVIFPMTYHDLKLNDPKFANILIVEKNLSLEKAILNTKTTEVESFKLPNEFDEIKNSTITSVFSSPSVATNASVSDVKKASLSTEVYGKLKEPLLFYIAIQTSSLPITSIIVSTEYVPRAAGPRDSAETVAFKIRKKLEAANLAMKKEEARLAALLLQQEEEERRKLEFERNQLEKEARLIRKLEEKKIRDAKAAEARRKKEIMERKELNRLQQLENILGDETLKVRNQIRPRSLVELAVQAKMKELVDYASGKEFLSLKKESSKQIASNEQPIISLSAVAANPEAYLAYQQELRQIQHEKMLKLEQEQMHVLANCQEGLVTVHNNSKEAMMATFEMGPAPTLLPPLKSKRRI